MSTAGSLPEGTRLGRYEIVSLLAAGGMGEVYVARDTNLGRQIALKVLPPELTSDRDRTARFVREAEASSALNHPAIVTVYDAGRADGVQYLAMELIDGEPLSEWMRTHRDTRRALELMAQVAEGLAVAHANGIVHRDLKPANIVVGRGGWAKVVDFGVAKLTERSNGASRGDTAPAIVIGTAAYMAPEQIEGRPVDHRADVYSFGLILQELLGETDSLPRDLQRIVRRCLARDPESRYQSMKDLALDLREASLDNPIPRPRRIWPVFLSLLLALSVLLVLFVLSKKPATTATTMTRLTNGGNVVTAAISPDGNYLVHAVTQGDQQTLWVKQVATGTLTRVAPPEPRYYFHLSVSPDGNYIYYISATRTEPNVADLYQIPLLGGVARRVANDIEFSYTISPDGKRAAFRRFNAFDREHRLTIADIDSGDEQIVLRRKHPYFVALPAWSPDGDLLTFVMGESGKAHPGIYEIDLNTRKIHRLETPEWPGYGSLKWMPDGTGLLVTVFDREAPPQIWFLGRDGATRKITSDINAYSDVTSTADGRILAAVRDETDSNIWTLDLGANARPGTAALRPVTTGLGNFFGGGSGVRWLNDREVLYSTFVGREPTFFAVDANGGQPRRMIHGMSAWNPALSPDGKKLAFVSEESGREEIWISDVDGSNAEPITHMGRVGLPTFSPDGRTIYFVSFGEHQYAWKVSAGGGEPEQLTDRPTNRPLVSPDGRFLLCRLRSSEPNVPLWRTAIVPLEGRGEPRFFDVPAYGGVLFFQWHPSGKSFSYLDTKDGVANVWLQDIDGGAPRQATYFESGEIFAYDWSRDGRRLVLSRGEPTSDAVLIRNFR